MKTTNLFIELLVIGVGALLCLTMILHLSLGFESFRDLPVSAPILLFPITAVTYVMGIVLDRIFDILTDPFDKFIRKHHLNEQQYQDVRTILYNDSKMVQEVFDYTKNRIRIVRSWMFYFLILSILVLFETTLPGKSRYFCCIILLLLSFLSIITFHKLSHSFYGLLKAARSNLD